MNNPLVYLIDDDAELTKVLERQFVGLGCDILSFTDLNSLLTAYGENRPDLLLIDLNLGEGLSGFTIIHKIRSEYKSDVPIIIISGSSDHRLIAHGLEIGANDYVVKPFQRSNFEEVLSNYIGSGRLLAPSDAVFELLSTAKRNSKLFFNVLIEEVHPLGFTLLSEHLIKKGTSFQLKGPQLQTIIPQCDQVTVTVMSAHTKVVGDQKKYQIQLEIDHTEEQALNEIRLFLSSKFSQRLIP